MEFYSGERGGSLGDRSTAGKGYAVSFGCCGTVGGEEVPNRLGVRRRWVSSGEEGASV